MLAPTPYFNYDMQNDINNNICENDFGVTLRFILPTVEYKEN